VPPVWLPLPIQLGSSGKWEDFGDMPQDVFRFRAAVAGGHLLFFGGQFVDTAGENFYSLTDNITLVAVDLSAPVLERTETSPAVSMASASIALYCAGLLGLWLGF